MPAKDRYHDTVKRALVKDGWEILSDQAKLKIENRHLWIDLQITHPERGITALIEVKELDEPSEIDSLASAMGKYRLYKIALKHKNILLPLYMAVSRRTYEGILSEMIGEIALKEFEVSLLVFEVENEAIIKWMP